jgi:hypothetical protein
VRKSQDDLYEAAKVIESLTGVPATICRPMTRKEKREQDERVRRFLALPPSLQEGALRYGENLRDAYKGGSVDFLLTQ